MHHLSLTAHDVDLATARGFPHQFTPRPIFAGRAEAHQQRGGFLWSAFVSHTPKWKALARWCAVHPNRTQPMQLGERQFTDGTTRPVIREDDGRQYVLDDESESVYGVWLHPNEYQEPGVLVRPWE